LLPLAGDVGERPTGEVTGFLILTSQQRHRGGVDARERVGTAFIGYLVPFG
jgi:hypothetical protein